MAWNIDNGRGLGGFTRALLCGTALAGGVMMSSSAAVAGTCSNASSPYDLPTQNASVFLDNDCAGVGGTVNITGIVDAGGVALGIYDGVGNQQDWAIVVAPGASATNSGFFSTIVFSSPNGSVENSGTISNTGVGNAIHFDNLGAAAGPGYVVNHNGGTIQSDTAPAIDFDAGGTLVNEVGGLIGSTNSGGLNSGGLVNVNNAGTVSIPNGNFISSSGGGTIVNSGYILGGLNLFNSGTAHITNTGTITGHANAAAIRVFAIPATVITSGDIIGGMGSPNAITFGAGDDRLELRPNFDIDGNVLADAGTDALVFSGTGNDSFDFSDVGAGNQYQDFEQIRLESGIWTFSGAMVEDFTVTGGTMDLGAGTVSVGNFTLMNGTVDNGTLTATSFTVEEGMIGADLSGGGALIKTGAGTVALAGSNTYAGVTDVLGGELVVDGSIASSSLTTVASGATLSGTGFVGDTVIASGGTLIGDQGATLTMSSLELDSGSIVDVSLGAPGTTALFGVTGDVTLDGTLNVTDAGGFSPGLYRIANYDGTLDDQGLDIGSVPTGVVASDLAVQTSIAGNVNLVYSIYTGDLLFWDGDALGNAGNGAIDGGYGVWTLANTNWTNTDGLVNGAMTPRPGFAIFAGGAGAVTVHDGLGAVSVTGMQFATGGYVVTGDSIELAGTSGEALIRVGDATAAGSSYTATIASDLTGSAQLVKDDLGTLVLTGNNSYAGGIRIDGGVLQVSDEANLGLASGTITFNGGTLATTASFASIRDVSLLADGAFDVAASASLDLHGGISGTGNLAKRGGGTLVLTGANGGFTGHANVDGGTLLVTDALGGTLDVNATGVLAGGGTVGTTTVQNGGTISPGADGQISTLTVVGDLTFEAGSTYIAHVETPGRSDLVSVSGTATINGGAVQIEKLSPDLSYMYGQSYRLLSASSVVENAALALSQPFLFLSAELVYGADHVDLLLSRRSLFADQALTANQFQAATALDDLEQGGDALAVFNELLVMTDADQARRAFDLASGEVHASGQHVVDQTFELFSGTMRGQAAAGVGNGPTGGRVHTAPLAYRPVARSAGTAAIDGATTAAYTNERVANAWLAPLGGRGIIDADGNAAELDWWTAGLAGGYEGPVAVASGMAWMGIGFGYMKSHGSADARLSTMDADNVQLGVYGGWVGGPWTFVGALAYGASRIDTERHIVFGGIDRTAEADYWAHSIGFSGEAAYAFTFGTGTTISPIATLDAGWSGHGGFTETGAGALNLTGASASWTRLDAGLGLALAHTFATNSGALTFEARAMWEHAFADVAPSQALVVAGSPTGFEVLGPDAGRDRLRLGAGVAFLMDEGLSVRARYDGLFSGSQQSHAGSIGLNVRF